MSCLIHTIRFLSKTETISNVWTAMCIPGVCFSSLSEASRFQWIIQTVLVTMSGDAEEKEELI